MDWFDFSGNKFFWTPLVVYCWIYEREKLSQYIKFISSNHYEAHKFLNLSVTIDMRQPHYGNKKF